MGACNTSSSQSLTTTHHALSLFNVTKTCNYTRLVSAHRPVCWYTHGVSDTQDVDTHIQKEGIMKTYDTYRPGMPKAPNASHSVARRT